MFIDYRTMLVYLHGLVITFKKQRPKFLITRRKKTGTDKGYKMCQKNLSIQFHFNVFVCVYLLSVSISVHKSEDYKHMACVCFSIGIHSILRSDIYWICWGFFCSIEVGICVKAYEDTTYYVKGYHFCRSTFVLVVIGRNNYWMYTFVNGWNNTRIVYS